MGCIYLWFKATRNFILRASLKILFNESRLRSKKQQFLNQDIGSMLIFDAVSKVANRSSKLSKYNFVHNA